MEEVFAEMMRHFRIAYEWNGSVPLEIRNEASEMWIAMYHLLSPEMQHQWATYCQEDFQREQRRNK